MAPRFHRPKPRLSIAAAWQILERSFAPPVGGSFGVLTSAVRRVDQAVDEAVAVAQSVGANLLAFEIGNEPDLFPGVHRPANYSYADYYAEYRRFKKAIREKLPNAPFAGPDVIVHADWLEQFAATEAADIKLLTYHYYAEGPPDNPSSTIENLLKPNAILPGLLGRLEAASRSSGVPYRICETNSCFGGGKPGVSDTMAAALWGLDFLFTLGAIQCRRRQHGNRRQPSRILELLHADQPRTQCGPFTTACWPFRWLAEVIASN